MRNQSSGPGLPGPGLPGPGLPWTRITGLPTADYRIARITGFTPDLQKNYFPKPPIQTAFSPVYKSIA